MGEATRDQDHEGLSQPTRDAVEDQLNRLLASQYFSHSKRLPSFLRFVVEHTLAGNVDNIKERTLGIEIFGRDAGYDTASDPIVRVTAAEIRKRVAQYYQEPEHEDELRISLPSGSYVPHFHASKGRNGVSLPELEPLAPAASMPYATHSTPPVAHAPRRRFWIVGLVCAASILLAGFVLIWQRTQDSPFDFFWRPVLATNAPILVCIADQNEYSVIALRDAADPSHQTVLKDSLTAVVIDDLNATVKVAGILESRGKQYMLKGEGATTLDDLRRGPTIFVGAFDNAWTLRLTDQLRYHFDNDAGMAHLWIGDSTRPGPSRWMVERSVQMATNNYLDYAILARFTDATTGMLEVVVAGIGRGGTRVAGEFLTDSADLAQLMRLAHAAGNKKNMEVVLSTEIIGGEPGTPKIEATYFW